MRENPRILRELFSKEVFNENSLESQWTLEHTTLAESIYKKYVKERENFVLYKSQGEERTVLHKGEEIFHRASSTIQLVKNLWNNASKITNYVKNNVEKSILSKELVPLFSKQEWIKDLISNEKIPFLLEQKENNADFDWVTQTIENVILQKKEITSSLDWNIKTLEHILLQRNKDNVTSHWNVEEIENLILQKNKNKVTSFLKQNYRLQDIVLPMRERGLIDTIKTDFKIISNVSNYPTAVAEMILKSNPSLLQANSTDSKVQQLFFRKNINSEESKANSSSELLRPLEQTIVYKIEKKSEETKETLNKEMKNFIYNQVEQIVQSKIEDYEVRRNQT